MRVQAPAGCEALGETLETHQCEATSSIKHQMNNFLTVLSQLVVIAAGACFSGCAGFIRDHGGCQNERNADVSAEQESTSGAIDVCKGSAHEDVVLICDTSWNGWCDEVFRTADGSDSAFFKVYAVGACNRSFDAPTIDNCTLLPSPGSRERLNGCLYKGRMGDFVFTYKIVSTPKPYVWVDNNDRNKKHVIANVTAALKLTFQYAQSCRGRNGEVVVVRQEEVVNNTSYVFNLKCTVEDRKK